MMIMLVSIKDFESDRRKLESTWRYARASIPTKTIPFERRALETTWLHATVGRIDRDTRTVLETRRKKKTNDLAFSVNDSHERVVHVTLRIDRLERVLLAAKTRLIRLLSHPHRSLLIFFLFLNAFVPARTFYFSLPPPKKRSLKDRNRAKTLLVTRFREEG